MFMNYYLTLNDVCYSVVQLLTGKRALDSHMKAIRVFSAVSRSVNVANNVSLLLLKGFIFFSKVNFIYFSLRTHGSSVIGLAYS